jgi:hypothetical protein
LELLGLASPVAKHGPAGRLQPQQLSYISLAIDLLLFVGAGMAA